MNNALTPKHNVNGWHVVDTDGGVWWPNEDAQVELGRAEDAASFEYAAALAVAICQDAPLRGEWRS